MSALEDKLLAQIKKAGLPEPVREFRFSNTRLFRFDFAYPDRLLAIEVQGGTWVAGGAHSRGSGIEADAEKLCEAAILGWRVLIVTSPMVRRGTAVKLLERALREPMEVQGWVNMPVAQE